MSEKQLSEREILKRKILCPSSVKDLDEIIPRIPYMLTYLGPGKWISVLKELEEQKSKSSQNN